MATMPIGNALHFASATASAGTSAGGTELRLVSTPQARDPRFLEKWQALAEDAAEPNPFYEPWCLIPSLRHLHGGGQFALFSYIVDGRLRGLIPIERAKRYYGHRVRHAAAWLHTNAFCSTPLVATGYERDFWVALLERLDRQPNGAFFLHLPQLPADGPMNAALDEVATRDDRLVVTVDEGERAMLSSDLGPEAYLEAAMSTKRRKELRRQYKRLAECGELTLERRDDDEGLAEWITEFLALENKGWKGEAGSALASEESTSAFFTDALTRATQAERLERLALRIDGRAVAMLANFVTPPGVFSFKTTFDEEYARFSPGLLLQLENLVLLEREGVQWADSCAVEGHSMIERLWREKRRIVSRNVAIGGKVRRFAFKQMAAYETRGAKS